MSIAEISTTTIKPITRAEKTAESVLDAVREATRAMEAEAAAMRDLEQTYKRANDASVELKNAIESNKEAALSVETARKAAKQAFLEVKKATEIESKADVDEERKQNKLKAEEAKLMKVAMAGKSANVSARNKAKHQAEEASQIAETAHRNVDRVKEILVAADHEVTAADGKRSLAEIRVQTAIEADKAAKDAVLRAEENAQRTIKVTKAALEMEAGAKKTMDLLIKKLKGIMAHEAKSARPIETASPVNELQEVKTYIVPIDNSLPAADVFSGTVKLLIASPVNHTMVKTFEERLKQVEGFRVKSVNGSILEGTHVTVLAEQPVPLLGRLKELEFVERVSRISRKEIEVTLKSAN